MCAIDPEFMKLFWPVGGDDVHGDDGDAAADAHGADDDDGDGELALLPSLSLPLPLYLPPVFRTTHPCPG